ncbi:unnamed protein product, partial [Vitrella brassicaformis CCMP3155]
MRFEWHTAIYYLVTEVNMVPRIPLMGHILLSCVRGFRKLISIGLHHPIPIEDGQILLDVVKMNLKSSIVDGYMAEIRFLTDKGRIIRKSIDTLAEKYESEMELLSMAEIVTKTGKEDKDNTTCTDQV